MTRALSVLVIGAGPAGASLAYVFASRGIAVTLVERHRDFAREFRGEGPMPSGASTRATRGRRLRSRNALPLEGRDAAA